MMIHETTFNGVLTERITDHGDGTGTRTTYNADGTVSTVEPLTGLPVVPPFPPLDALGRMATLSAILHGDVEDWANAAGVPAEHLVHEAQAWAVAATPPVPSLP